MKLAIVIIAMLLIPTVLSESTEWMDYKWSFDMQKPHIMDGNSVIRTYYGQIDFYLIGKAGEMSLSDSIGSVETKNGTFYIFRLGCGTYDAYPLFTRYSDEPVNPAAVSTMNLTDTIDFLKTLKVEPIKK